MTAAPGPANEPWNEIRVLEKYQLSQQKSLQQEGTKMAIVLHFFLVNFDFNSQNGVDITTSESWFYRIRQLTFHRNYI